MPADTFGIRLMEGVCSRQATVSNNYSYV